MTELTHIATRPSQDFLTAAPTPFGQWRWLHAWSRTVAEGSTLRIMESGHAQFWGGMALCVRDHKVRLAGDGLSDLGHVLGATEAVCAMLMQLLEDERHGVRLAELSLFDVSRICGGVGRPGRVDVSSWCPMVDVTIWEEQAFTGRAARLIRHARRVLSQTSVSHEVIERPTAEAVELVIALSRRNVALGANALDDPTVRAFVERYWADARSETSTATVGDAVPCVSLLRAGDEVVSGFLCIAHAGRLYYYLSGSKRHRDRYGIAHLVALMDWMRDADFEVLNLLRGLERYKLDFASRLEPRFVITWDPVP